MSERAKRHPLATTLLALLLISGVGTIAWFLTQNEESNQAQKKLNPFYDTSDIPPGGRYGDLVRQEKLRTTLKNGTAYRVIYRTLTSDGHPTFSSGRIFVPRPEFGSRPRQVVAWAHGTLGLGDECAPSRAKDPTRDLPALDEMLKIGWVVTATDYAGLGTPGEPEYLVGKSEAYDVINSVRAASQVKDASTGRSFAVWGHSQGGNSALFAATELGRYASDLELDGTVASAPAADLVSLFRLQYGKPVEWVIGPMVSVSWPAAEPSLIDLSLLSKEATRNYKRLANECVLRSSPEAIVRSKLGEQFFTESPADTPTWRTMAKMQSGPIMSPDQPLLVVESENDKVVPPQATATYIKDACRRKSDLQAIWLSKASHESIPKKSADDVVRWIQDRFTDQPTKSTCNKRSPVKASGG